jgi:hypothetical protein
MVFKEIIYAWDCFINFVLLSKWNHEYSVL